MLCFLLRPVSFVRISYGADIFKSLRNGQVMGWTGDGVGQWVVYIIRPTADAGAGLVRGRGVEER